MEGNRDHLLEEILLIAHCSGVERGQDMEEYGRARRDWMKRFRAEPASDLRFAEAGAIEFVNLVRAEAGSKR